MITIFFWRQRRHMSVCFFFTRSIWIGEFDELQVDLLLVP